MGTFGSALSLGGWGLRPNWSRLRYKWEVGKSIDSTFNKSEGEGKKREREGGRGRERKRWRERERAS